MKLLTYKSLKAKVNPPNYVTDIKKFESYFSLICSIVLSSLLLIIAIQSNSNEIIKLMDVTRNILLNSTFGLLGMLGFIVSGLAIITGTIGNKITQKMIEEDKYNSLLSILYSFVYIGRFIGILIVVLITVYFFVSIPLSFNIYLFVGLSFVLSYCLFFSVFFAVSLLVTCINIFQLNFIYSEDKDSINKNNEKVDMFFNDARIDTLTSILINKANLTKEEFTAELNKNIYNDCPEEYKKMVIEKAKKYYHFE
ncbi:hypothetical protein [Bacillus haynesii]|uniref:hypothetical protein n=1 Tax=Bacillus haynesii TaxID=1925021 RepID=UPI001C227C28|nr:hypothetical protein [Bacillus haynesii]MBU8682825.1 hypothetical protein [Bacillus haynesii]MCY8143670.1 hypothetical protein [Bacillus haynesii]MCY8641439.1 hypothetical protein [Bacillus haynesii]MEC1454844.1 hypothetical protein [Bacillus haynesii]MEC1505008.1 hypothetical protein [Bacillus haynesii]